MMLETSGTGHATAAFIGLSLVARICLLRASTREDHNTRPVFSFWPGEPVFREASFIPIAPLIPDIPYMPLVAPKWVNGHQNDWSRVLQFEPSAYPFIKDLNGLSIQELPAYNGSVQMWTTDHVAWCMEYKKYLLEHGMNGVAERFSAQESHAQGNVFGRHAMNTGFNMTVLFKAINKLSRQAEPQMLSHLLVCTYTQTMIAFACTTTLTCTALIRARLTMYIPAITPCFFHAAQSQLLTFDEPRLTRYGYLHGATVMFIGNWAHSRISDAAFPYHFTKGDWKWMVDTICSPGDDMQSIHMHFCLHGIGHAVS